MDAETHRSRGKGFLSGNNVDRPALAAMLMIGSLSMLGLQDALIKFTSSEVSIWQFQMLRSAMNLALLAILARAIWGTGTPKPKSLWAVTLRSLFLVFTMVMFFGGIPFLSLAEIAAGLYTYPLYIALLSTIALGERVGFLRIVAILAGFIGTLMILKPGSENFGLVNLMPVAAGFGYACTVMTTRRLCREESPVTLAFGVALAFLIVGAIGTLVFSAGPTITYLAEWRMEWPYLFTGWRDMPLWVVLLVVVCSILNLTANIGLAKSYQTAESSWLAPFDYSYLIFATFWGFVFSGNIPDILTFGGMALIASAGTFVAWRERRNNQELTRANFNRNLR